MIFCLMVYTFKSININIIQLILVWLINFNPELIIEDVHVFNKNIEADINLKLKIM